MTLATILDWTDRNLADFGKSPVRMTHSLHTHPLFSDASLARLLQGIERSDYYVNTMDVSAHNVRSRREGEIRDLPGDKVLEAVKSGQIWILVLKPDRVEPGYKAILRDIYDEIASKQPGFKSSFEKLSILISSPGIQVYYHCDIPGQSLWQVRGNKKVYVYPNNAPYLEQAALEKIVLGEAHEISLRYDPKFDDAATVFDLQPGEMLHWPLNCPHRIINGDNVNISFTTEHFTTPIRRTYHVNFANGLLRHRLGMNKLSTTTTGPAYWSKFGLGLAYKASGLHKKRLNTLKVDFQVDPAAPKSVRTIPGYEYKR